MEAGRAGSCRGTIRKYYIQVLLYRLLTYSTSSLAIDERHPDPPPHSSFKSPTPKSTFCLSRMQNRRSDNQPTTGNKISVCGCGFRIAHRRIEASNRSSPTPSSVRCSADGAPASLLLRFVMPLRMAHRPSSPSLLRSRGGAGVTPPLWQ